MIELVIDLVLLDGFKLTLTHHVADSVHGIHHSHLVLTACVAKLLAILSIAKLDLLDLLIFYHRILTHFLHLIIV